MTAQSIDKNADFLEIRKSIIFNDFCNKNVFCTVINVKENSDIVSILGHFILKLVIFA